jgi:Na+/H+ antiporter NhaD/arsenite permease-like protein
VGTLKLIGLGIAWMLASIAIAVVAAMLGTELLDVVGVVESGETSYTVAINSILVLVFVGLILIPFLLRDRFVDPDVDDLEQ